MSDTDRFERAIRSIDEANGEDPNSEVVDGVAQPKELVYGARMQKWVEKLDPRAPEALRIAARPLGTTFLGGSMTRTVIRGAFAGD